MCMCTSWLLWWASPRIMSHTAKPHNLQTATVRLPPRWLFPLKQTIQPEGTWCDQRVNQNMWSATSTPPISIEHSPTPYIHSNTPTWMSMPSCPGSSIYECHNQPFQPFKLDMTLLRLASGEIRICIHMCQHWNPQIIPPKANDEPKKHQDEIFRFRK